MLAHFHLNPTQVGIPNDRPRYYCVAVRKRYLAVVGYDGFRPSDLFQQEDNIPQTDPFVQTSIACLEVQPLSTNIKEKRDEYNSVPSMSKYLDTDSDVSTELEIPNKILKSNTSWCFDIVTRQDRRSACFTQSYGKFVRGTGSVLYTGPLQLLTEKNDTDFRYSKNGDVARSENARDRFRLVSPEQRRFDPEWSEGLNLKRHLRYFSGIEIARLMGFPVSMPNISTASGSACTFSFPDSCSMKQQWKLLGNSLNVRVAARVAELGLCAVTKAHGMA